MLPFFFSGSNSLIFHLFGLFHPRIRTVLLAREMLNKRDRTLEAQIGKMIQGRRLKEFKTDRDTTEYLRKRTYLLAHREMECISPKCRHGVSPALKTGHAPIAPSENPAMLETEIRGLEEENILIDRNDFLVAHANAWEAPKILHEIGRLM